MQFRTERLLLRPLKISDLPDMIEYATKPEFYRYLPVQNQTAETIEAFFDERMKDQENTVSTRYTFAVALAETDQIIGSLRNEMQDQKRNIADIGYTLDQRFEGNGYMTEAVSRLLTFGFDTFRASEIWAQVHKENEKSWRLLERLGMLRADLPKSLKNRFSGIHQDEYHYVCRNLQKRP